METRWTNDTIDSSYDKTNQRKTEHLVKCEFGVQNRAVAFKCVTQFSYSLLSLSNRARPSLPPCEIFLASGTTAFAKLLSKM